MSLIQKKLFELLTWLALIISAILLNFIATDFFIFPSRYKYPFLLFLIALVCITGICSVASRGWFRKFAGVMNIIICLLMMITFVMLPNIENRIRKIFNNVKIDNEIINVYVLNKNYKDNIDEFKTSKYIIQNSIDQDNQNYAIEALKTKLEKDSLLLVRKDDVISAVEALYKEEGTLLILNEAIVPMIEEFEGFGSFSDDCKAVYSINREVEVEQTVIDNRDITEKTFIVYTAGCDTRTGRLTTYGRTDVNLMVCVNPNTKQIMIVGIPRDAYIRIPALDNQKDKLTHLGNHGIMNTLKGVNNHFNIDIDYYGEVIFDTFRNVVNAVDGIDVENPYYFNTIGGNGSLDGTVYEFPEGNIRLYGDSALAYCRERYNLPNGDYGRNEHQTIALKALIQKLLSPSILENYNSILNALNGQFLTNMDMNDIFKLIGMQLDDNSSWEIITYHLGGQGMMQGTASMGWERMLYTVNLFDTQVNFIRNEIEKMNNDERIKQQTLPNDADTTYIPN